MQPLSRGTIAVLLALGAALQAAGSARAITEEPLRALGRASHVVIPQVRGFAITDRREAIFTVPESRETTQVRSVAARIEIHDRVSSTTLDIALENTGGRLDEAVLLIPVPRAAVVSGFAFDGPGDEPTAEIMLEDEARSLYDSIVARVRDPALLEFAGYDLVRSSVFPVPAFGTQRVRIVYEQLLTGDGDRIDYVLPRSESLEARAAWTIDVDVHSERAIATVYSPTHDIANRRVSASHVTVRLDESPTLEPGPFRLAILPARRGASRDDIASSFFAYPDPRAGGGYFLLMAGLPDPPERAADRIAREVTIVLDRSGSMAGPKMTQARDAALAIVDELAMGEVFNIIDYASSISMFAPGPVAKSATSTRAAREYLRDVRPHGGTNVHDAVLEALRQPPTPSTLPLVLFLTDGLPTIGRTGERTIREMVEMANVHERRIFTIGVGADVNAPLLDRIADVTRGAATYAPIDEELETTLSRVFRRLHGPVLAGPRLEILDARGRSRSRRVSELNPRVIPDVFEDDQLIVLGRYRGDDPMTFVLEGVVGEEDREFRFTFDPASATTRHAFVPRLWASRQITRLVDEIRQSGADDGERLRLAAATWRDDPERAAIVEEILSLSTEFGILTEYTAFLATEGTDLSDWDMLSATCERELDERAVKERSGLGALSQAVNHAHRKSQVVLNLRNAFVDRAFDAVEFDAVRQMCDRAFFRRGNRWIDSRLLDGARDLTPERSIMIGTDEYIELTRRLAREGRQGLLSLPGETLMELDGRTVLVNDGC